MIEVAVGDGSGDPRAKEPLPPGLTPKQKNIARIRTPQKLLFRNAIILPEPRLRREQLSVYGQHLLPEKEIVLVSGHAVCVRLVQFNYFFNVLVTGYHVVIVFKLQY